MRRGFGVSVEGTYERVWTRNSALSGIRTWGVHGKELVLEIWLFIMKRTPSRMILGPRVLIFVVSLFLAMKDIDLMTLYLFE